MKKFAEWLKTECNEEMPEGNINGSWFAERGLPMIVSCTCCGTTMALPSAYVNEDNECFCSSCAGE